MARALRICHTQLTHLCLLPLLGAVAFWLLIPVLFGTAMLDARAASQLLEGVFPLAGALLLVPLFAPERRPGLLDCVAARRASHLWVCGLRAAAMLGVLALLDAGLWLLMAAQGCAVSTAQLLAAFANGLALGALGLLASALSASEIVGALAALGWYTMDFFSDSCGGASLFLLSRGRGAPKFFVLAAGLLLLGAAFLVFYRRMRR